MAENEQQSVLNVLVELVDKATEPLHQLSESFETFESGIWDVSKAFGSAFLGYELFESLIEPASDFQQAQVRLALATRASTEELAKFKEQAKDLSETYPATIEQVTAAQTELYNTFRNADTMKEGTEIADKLATVMRSDVTDAARILSSATLNLGEKNKTTIQSFQELSDKIALLNTRYPVGSSGAARMARDFARLGASAHTYGLDINQVFALLGELNRMHIAGQQGAGMFAQSLIHELGAVNDKGVNSLAKYGLQIAKTHEGHLNLIATLQNMSRMSPNALKHLEEHLPGQAQALSTIVDHMKDLTDSYYEFRDAAGTTADAVGKQSQTYEFQMDRFKNSLTNLKELFGIMALPTFTQTTENLTQIVKALEDFSDTHPAISETITKLALMAAAMVTLVGVVGFATKLLGFFWATFSNLPVISTAIEMLGNLVFAMRLVAVGAASMGEAFGLAFESNPIGWIITAVALIALGVYEIWKHWDDIKNTIQDVRVGLAGLWTEMKGLGFLNSVKAALPALAQGNVGGAVAALSVAGAQYLPNTGLHYAPTINVYAGANADGPTIAHALQSQLDDHSTSIIDQWQEAQRSASRRSFSDQTGGR